MAKRSSAAGAGGKKSAASAKAGASTRRGARKKKGAVAPSSRGLTPAETADNAPARLRVLAEQVEADGGRVLASFRDPLGGHWQMLVALPLEKVAPTPFQRDLSEAHAARLATNIERLGRFLDPIVAIRSEEGRYWTPNGNHRRDALARLGARAITALLVPEPEIAYQILALNTEKAHNLKEKSLEVIRMARALAQLAPVVEADYALQFEEPAFLTLGVCYEQRARFAGSSYHPVLKRVDAFAKVPLAKALPVREARAAVLLQLDDAVNAAVAALKERGLQSPYLKAFVVARVNPIRFSKGAEHDQDAVLGKMLAAAQRFDAAKVRADQLASASGPPEE